MGERDRRRERDIEVNGKSEIIGGGELEEWRENDGERERE